MSEWGKGHGLAREVAQIADVHADLLFTSRTRHCSRLSPGSTKPASALCIPGAKCGERASKELVVALHQGHDRWRDARIVGLTAFRTLARPLAKVQYGGRAAAATVLVRAVPIHDLDGAAGEREHHIVEQPEQCA